MKQVRVPKLADMPTDSPILLVQGLKVQVGDLHLLRGVNLEVSSGETLAIVGESGCGKTVLMKTIIGLVQPTSGAVSFDGQNINALNDQDLSYLRLRFGFVENTK